MTFKEIGKEKIVALQLRMLEKKFDKIAIAAHNNNIAMSVLMMSLESAALKLAETIEREKNEERKRRRNV